MVRWVKSFGLLFAFPILFGACGEGRNVTVDDSEMKRAFMKDMRSVVTDRVLEGQVGSFDGIGEYYVELSIRPRGTNEVLDQKDAASDAAALFAAAFKSKKLPGQIVSCVLRIQPTVNGQGTAFVFSVGTEGAVIDWSNKSKVQEKLLSQITCPVVDQRPPPQTNPDGPSSPVQPPDRSPSGK